MAVAGCDSGTTPSPGSSLPVPAVTGTVTIDLDRAKALAMEAIGGGQITDIEMDDENNTPVWKVTVVGSDGVRHRISINQRTGAIVANEVVQN
jgi:uncharacterized membrane protein YkoI